jgi:uncharacterized protein (DUF2141 family)
MCTGGLSRAATGEAASDSHVVTVNVGSFRNARGFLGCRLFRSPDGFPETGQDVVEIRVPITGETTECEFRNVAAGTYALSVMHDENGNRKLDKNLFGMPTEGYGVSNNKTYAMSLPKWSESKFDVRAQDIVLSIRIRY